MPALHSTFAPISIHALREEGDPEEVCRLCMRFGISIHALREEGDKIAFGHFVVALRISIHALREEGDANGNTIYDGVEVFLSTPSARRATCAYAEVIRDMDGFLSTPSARRATSELQTGRGEIKISIHALREEGDSKNRDKISIFL